MFARLFLNHPRSVDESYLEHLVFAGGFAFRLIGAGLAALIHALIPCLFEKTAGNMIAQMYAKISKRSN